MNNPFVDDSELLNEADSKSVGSQLTETSAEVINYKKNEVDENTSVTGSEIFLSTLSDQAQFRKNSTDGCRIPSAESMKTAVANENNIRDNRNEGGVCRWDKQLVSSDDFSLKPFSNTNCMNTADGAQKSAPNPSYVVDLSDSSSTQNSNDGKAFGLEKLQDYSKDNAVSSDSLFSEPSSFCGDIVSMINKRFGDLDNIVNNITQLYTNLLADDMYENDLEEDLPVDLPVDANIVAEDIVKPSASSSSHCETKIGQSKVHTETKAVSDSTQFGSASFEGLKNNFDTSHKSAVLNEQLNSASSLDNILQTVEWGPGGRMKPKCIKKSKSDEKLYVWVACKVCHKQFKSKKNLRQHVYIHRAEKPFECSICLKRFNFSVELTRHKIKHSLDKPIKCMICEKQFKTKKTLKQHTVTHSGEKKYECFICQKRFFFPSDLKRHVSIHTGETKHQCLICSKYFVRSGDLNRHMQIHTGEKPYICSACDAGFIKSSDLTRHMLSHAGVKLFKCEICGKPYARYYTLKQHCIKHHGQMGLMEKS